MGIRDRVAAPTLAEFGQRDFVPFIEARSQNKAKTLEYYRNGLKNLNAHPALANCRLDAIRHEHIASFVTKQRKAGLAIASINRQLEVLRRMFKLAVEWSKVERALPKVEMLRGENRRERVLSEDEENRYLEAATQVGDDTQAAYDNERDIGRGGRIRTSDLLVPNQVTTENQRVSLTTTRCSGLSYVIAFV